MKGSIILLLCALPAVLPAKYLPKWKKQACEVPGVQSEHSHYICDEKGEPRCRPGWQGDLCDVPICKKGCDPLQGYCKRPGECRCKIGFYGEKCNKCIPLPGCQHGYCNVSFECICKEGWDGIFCSEPICRSDCHNTRGFCESPGECRCRLGWAGPTCRACQPLPGCQNGYCDKPLECRCSPGYTGLLCQTPICAAGCHPERGYCRRPGECRCKVGWTGRECAQCHRYPGCVHGSCRRPWECLCEPGWGGMLCDEELNYCEKNPDTCLNGGRCQSLESGDGYFRCSCPLGFTGKHCEIQPESTLPAVNSTELATSAKPESAEKPSKPDTESETAESSENSETESENSENTDTSDKGEDSSTAASSSTVKATTKEPNVLENETRLSLFPVPGRASFLSFIRRPVKSFL